MARGGVLDAHLGDCHLGHVDQRVHSGFPRHGRHGYGRLEVPGGHGHAEVDPAAAADDAIDITRCEEVADHHLGAGGSQRRSPFVLAPHHGANPKPSIEEQAGDSASDRPHLAACPGYQYQSVIYHAPYFLAPPIIITSYSFIVALTEHLLC